MVVSAVMVVTRSDGSWGIEDGEVTVRVVTVVTVVTVLSVVGDGGEGGVVRRHDTVCCWVCSSRSH